MKFIAKKIGLIIVILLMVSILLTLVSCDTNNSSENKTEEHTDAPTQEQTEETGKFTEKVRKDIQNAYFEKTYKESNKEWYNSPDQVEVTCYGSFDNAHCVMITHSGAFYAEEITYIEVAGFKFVFSSSNIMSVYYEGDFYSLQNAYENGILSEAEIEKLHTDYMTIKWGKTDVNFGTSRDPWKLSDETKRNIQLAYLKKVYGEEYDANGFSPEDFLVACYGIFDNVYCVVISDNLGGQDGTVTEVTVAEQTVVFKANDVMQVYCDDMLYDLDQAYENDILNESDIEKLLVNLNAKYVDK